MKRRDFIKLLAGLPLIGSLPVIAKHKSIAFDGVDSYLRSENDPTMGGFTLGSNFNPADLDGLTMWQGFEVDGKGGSRWVDKLTGKDPFFSSEKIKESYYFDVKHTENERAEVIAAMKRDKPASYFKRFRGYKAGKKEIDNE